MIDLAPSVNSCPFCSADYPVSDMEGSQSSEEASRFRAFGNGVTGASQESAGDRELHNVGIASQTAGAYLNGRRSFPSEFCLYGTSVAGSNQHFQGFSHSASLHDEQSLSSAFEGMALGLKTCTDDPPTSHRNVGLTNGHYSSGHLDVSLNHMPVTRQDDSLPLQFSAALDKQNSDIEHQEHGYGFLLHSGKFTRNSSLQSSNSNFGVPYHPSVASAPPFQQQSYVDGQSQMYRPHDQNVGSNFIWPHDIGVQPYSIIQPHYVCPQMQQVSGFDGYQHRSNEHAAVFTSANVPSSNIGIPNSHGLENGYPYFNVAAFQKSNRLNNAFTDGFPSTSYTESSCGSADFRHFQRAEKFFSPSGQGFSHHQQTDNPVHSYGLGTSYTERNAPSHGVGNSTGAMKFSPSVNGFADMDHRINGYGNDHLGIQSNNPMLLSSSPKIELTVDEVVGRICILAKDQNGCYFLHKMLTEGTQEDADKVFCEITDHIGELMVDPVANCLVQRILGNNDRRMHIICEITKAPADLIKVCCNPHGYDII